MPPKKKLSLTDPLQYLKGVGPARAKLLAERGILTLEDLLYYPPFRYEDRSRITLVRDLKPGLTATVLLKVEAAGLSRTRRGTAIFDLAGTDETGLFHCKWFHASYLETNQVFESGRRVYFHGKVEWDPYRKHRLQMIQPNFEIVSDSNEETDSTEMQRIVPVYEAVGAVNARLLRRLVASTLVMTQDAIPETLPASICRRTGLPARAAALEQTHLPPEGTSLDELQEFRTPAQKRLIFEEFFFLGVGLSLRRKKAKTVPGFSFKPNEKVRSAIKTMLPFHPTAAQKRVLKEIVDDMKAPVPMNRLLQGDVGSGKTIVALQAAVLAMGNGAQVALMAPTEILATQHYLYTKRLMAKLPYRIGLLVSGQKASEREATLAKIRAGEIDLVVGTHALIQGRVEFARLGLAIVDEQHRFGVLQRYGLIRKGASPDVLVMTATPIPRTLALTLYGDLDVSVLDELPPNRVPVETTLFTESQRHLTFEFIRERVRRGEQAYIVYPVIEEGGKTELRPAVQMYQHLAKNVFPELPVALLHGRLRSREKEAVMEKFKGGEVQVLVATQVVEVGVDVPNATVMLIEHADRFGLAQLHQLRGRIGRGGKKSHCLLTTPEKISEIAEKRLQSIAETTDGFKIAETDLRLRGPGEFFGTRQWGVPAFRMANILRDQEILEWAKREAQQFVERPGSPEELEATTAYLQKQWSRRYALSQIA